MVKLLQGDPGTSEPAAIQSVPKSAAAVDPCRVVSLPVHDAGRTPADRPMVEPGARVSVISPPSACGLEHARQLAGSSSRTGRTSTLPSRAGGILAATWIASFKSLASIR